MFICNFLYQILKSKRETGQFSSKKLPSFCFYSNFANNSKTSYHSKTFCSIKPN